MFKRVQEAEEKWRGAQALIEQIKVTFSEKERELENKMEELKRQQEKELFKLNQDNYILQAKVLDTLSYFSFYWLKRTCTHCKCIVILCPWSYLTWCICYIKYEHGSQDCLLTTEPKSKPLGKKSKFKLTHFDNFLLLAVFFENKFLSSLWPSKKTVSERTAIEGLDSENGTVEHFSVTLITRTISTKLMI